MHVVERLVVKCRLFINALSKRKFHLFIRMADGSSILEIAKNFSISPKIVGVRHTSIVRNCKLQHSAQFIQLAIHCYITQL
ncbi:hypothetical protein NTGM5_180067 [Candidatus Nitrotoga sp. M5]|nr:hypothetical protein NTGM5_180067 [Candidatus Nitrotoga sp. M5]